MTQAAIIVPARLASTRFPRKLLHEIRGKPLLIWVAERIAREAPQWPLFFAVDDEALRAVLAARGFQAVMTRPDHASGTDRLAEANAAIGADVVINVQADEPLISGGQIKLLAAQIARDCPMATLASRFRRVEDFFNPNQVKVVLSQTGEALYFSRAPIPFARELRGDVTVAWLEQHAVHRHMGVYAYRAAFLREFSRLPHGRLEEIEKLEQLRALENNQRIAVGITDEPTVGIDTLEDVAEFERHLDGRGRG